MFFGVLKYSECLCMGCDGCCVFNLYCVSFGSNVSPRTFGCVAMSSAALFILSSRLLLYSGRSGVNSVQGVCLNLV